MKQLATVIVPVLSLALLPATLVAAPTEFHKIQDIVGIETAPRNTWTKTKVWIDNSWPLDVAPYLLHWPGNLLDDNSKPEVFAWDYVFPDDNTTQEDMKFNTSWFTASSIMAYSDHLSAVRKDWDWWEAGIQFRDPNWTMRTNLFEASPGIDNIPKGLKFNLKREKLTATVPGHDVCFTSQSG